MTDIKLYGMIDSALALATIQSMGLAKDEITLHIHSVGGSVVEGFVLYNTIKAQSKKVSCVIDGMAASMAAILMLACEDRKMVDNGWLMLHAPSSYTRGNKQDLKQMSDVLQTTETHFKQILAASTKLSEEEINTLMDGKDYWYNAQEALAKGLITEIIPAIYAEASVNMHAICATGKADLQELYTHFKPQIKHMDTNKHVQQLRALGVTGVMDNEPVEALLAKASEALRAQKEANDNLLKAVAEAQKKAIEAVVEDAISAKKIPSDQKETYVKVGEGSGIETLKAVLSSIKAHTPISSLLQNEATPTTQAQAQDRNAWSYGDWQEKDPKGLEALLSKDPEKFKKTFDEKTLG